LLFALCRVRFHLKTDTNLFEIAKCKTSVSAIEVLLFYF
jgi:peptidylprolyl isomerase domain and WD repeat-containing protein 1